MDIVRGDIANLKLFQTDKSNLKKRKMKAIKTNIRILQINRNNATTDSAMDTHNLSEHKSEKKLDELLDPDETNTTHYEASEHDGKHQLRTGNVNLNIEAEVDPLEIELLDPDDYIFGHKGDKTTKVFESSSNTLSRECRNDHQRKETTRSGHKMDVYNELKMSVHRDNKKLKDNLLDVDVGGLDQMAYAPHSYLGHDEDWKALKPLEISSNIYGESNDFQSKSYVLPNSGPRDCRQNSCKSCCRRFDSRDLCFVFLFGLVVGLLAIIATTVLYSVFFVVKKSCCSGPENPYEITLTRDHHYRDPEECKACCKCRKCCDCDSEHETRRHKKRCAVNPRMIDHSANSDVIPTSKWRLPLRHWSCEAIGRLLRKSSNFK